jgi:transcriptional regulator with XRE-family HTH domain
VEQARLLVPREHRPPKEGRAIPYAKDRKEVDRIIGVCLKVQRLQKGMRQQDLARLLNINAPEVSYLERGRRRLTVVRLLEICDALGSDPADFMTKASRFTADVPRETSARGEV